MRFPPASTQSLLRSTHRSDESHPAPCTDMASAKRRLAGVREAAPALFPLPWRCPSGGKPAGCARSHANPSALLESEGVARSSEEVRVLLQWAIDRLSCLARSPPCPPQPTTHPVPQTRKGNSASRSASVDHRVFDKGLIFILASGRVRERARPAAMEAVHLLPCGCMFDTTAICGGWQWGKPSSRLAEWDHVPSRPTDQALDKFKVRYSKAESGSIA